MLVEDSGIEPLTQACKASVFPIRLIPRNLRLTTYHIVRHQSRRVLAPVAGIEPTTNWLTVNCTTAVLHWNIKFVAGEVSVHSVLWLAHSPFTFLTTKLGAPWQNRTAVAWLQNRCNTIILIGQNLVSLAGFEPAPHGPKPWTLPDYAIER